MIFAKRLSEVKGFEDFKDYAVTKFGDVYSFKKRNPRKLKPGVKSHGYKFVLLRANMKTYNTNLHVIVATAFCKNTKNKEVDHIDGNPKNNHYKNLEWVTHKENMIRGRGEKIYKLNLNGKILQSYRSKAEAANKNKFLNTESIRLRYTNHAVVGGYVWVKQKDLNDNINVKRETDLNEVYKLDKKNNIIKKYRNANIAGKEKGFNRQCIYNCIKGKQKTHRGYKFVYVEDFN